MNQGEVVDIQSLDQIIDQVASLGCPFVSMLTEKTLFQPCDVRYQMLEWLYFRFDPCLRTMFTTKANYQDKELVNERANRILSYSSLLGIPGMDLSIAEGTAPKAKQIGFLTYLCELVSSIADIDRDSSAKTDIEVDYSDQKDFAILVESLRARFSLFSDQCQIFPPDIQCQISSEDRVSDMAIPLKNMIDALSTSHESLEASTDPGIFEQNPQIYSDYMHQMTEAANQLKEYASNLTDSKDDLTLWCGKETDMDKNQTTLAPALNDLLTHIQQFSNGLETISHSIDRIQSLNHPEQP